MGLVHLSTYCKYEVAPHKPSCVAVFVCVVFNIWMRDLQRSDLRRQGHLLCCCVPMFTICTHNEMNHKTNHLSDVCKYTALQFPECESYCHCMQLLPIKSATTRAMESTLQQLKH
eukprot:2236293-Pleurochrysis_carterae.AAC.3